jgi:hypothetical protein
VRRERRHALLTRDRDQAPANLATRILRGAGTGVEQGEALDALGCDAHDLERHAPSHRMARERKAFGRGLAAPRLPSRIESKSANE